MPISVLILIPILILIRHYIHISNGNIDSNGIGRTVRTSVKNAREFYQNQNQNGNQMGNLDVEGFLLVKDNTATSLTSEDFYGNPDKIKAIYYSEMANLLKRVTGATDAIAFHHQLR